MDKKSYSVLKDRVREVVVKIYGIQNLPAKFNPTDFFPSRVELHSQQIFGKNNILKSGFSFLSVACRRLENKRFEDHHFFY